MSLRIQLCAFIFAMFAPFATMAYTVTYDCGDADGTPPEIATATTGEDFTPVMIMNNSCVRDGYVLSGWAVSGTNHIKTGIFKWDYTEDKTLKAQWVEFDPKFTITTTNMSAGSTFKYWQGAYGLFYVDWGDGTFQTIDSIGTIEHTYATGGVYTIRFDGVATDYRPITSQYRMGTVSFGIRGNSVYDSTGSLYTGNPQFVAEISGSLGAIYPSLPSGKQPQFVATFSNCTELNSEIPARLFSGVTGSNDSNGQNNMMFMQTFDECNKLSGSIPEGLFGDLNNALTALGMFQETFKGCSELSGQIPTGLFSGVTGIPRGLLFNGTFYECGNLSGSIPGNLFSTISGSANEDINTINLRDDATTYKSGATGAFMSTFKGCSNLSGQIPGNLFENISGSANYLFSNTFQDCENLTGQIPSDLFKNITGNAGRMFKSTFMGCKNLTSISEDLFGHITNGVYSGVSGSAVHMFDSTFYLCSGLTGQIPENLFGRKYNGTYYGVSGAAESLFQGTFASCSGITSIPENLFQGISGGAPKMFYGTFFDASGITGVLPQNLFANVNVAATALFDGTFKGCTSLTGVPDGLFRMSSAAPSMFYRTFKECTGLTEIPKNLFSDITTAATGLFSETFNGCSNLSGYVPTTTFSGLIANHSPKATDMWKNTFSDTNVATSCEPYSMAQYITGYEGNTASGDNWNGKVSCLGNVVTYDCGGGTGTPPEDMVAYSGETFTPAANTCERQGYVFVGWGVSDTDGPDVVSDHEPFTWNYTTNKTFIARWACDTLSGYTMNPDTGQCVETYTATFDCEKQSSFYSNPNGAPFEKTVMYGESISMDQNPCQIKPSLVENFTCKGEISDWIYEPNQKWSYLVPGTTVNREAFRDDTNFLWEYHDDITFRPVNIIPGWTIRYYCGIAGGTPPAQSGINYNYCADIGIAAPTNCTTDPLLEFKGWSVIYNSNEVATIAPGVSRYTDGWWPGATTLVAQWQCADGSTWNSETGTCVQNTYTATFDCAGANGNFPFVNPEAGLESITGVREGSQVTLPSPQLCELRADLPACGKTSFAPRISAGNNHWRYDSGEAQPGDFLWPFNNDITFYLRGYNHSGVIVSYDCGVAGGTAPSNFTVNYSNCDSVTIAEPTECNQIQGASFYKWQVNTSAGKLLDPGPYDQDWNLGPAKLIAQWVCDNPKQVIVNGECVETYTATFYCDAMEDSPFQNPASGLEPITGIVLNDSVDLHSTALCEYKPNVPQCGREGYYQVQPKDVWYAAGRGNASSPFSWIYNSSISFLLWGYNNNVSTINYDCGIIDARPTVPSLAINYWNCNNVVIEQGSNCTPAVSDPHMYFVNWKYKTAGYLNPGRYVENDGVWDLRNITLVAQWACESGYQMNSANATCEPCNNNEVWVDGICQPCAYRTQPNADGTACEACNDNDLWVDGICQPCEPGAQLNEYGTACVLCVEGQHIEKGQCVDDVIECDAPNATHAVRTWSEAVRGYSSCRVIDCMDGYHLESNTCVLDDQSCSVANGSGRREWNTKTNQWEICQIIDCDPGFELVGDECIECNNRLDENGDVAVSSYVSGCQIASCMYQGQKYILDGDECKLICKNQEDGTGAMFWDDNVKKCIRTCNPGYKMW